MNTQPQMDGKSPDLCRINSGEKYNVKSLAPVSEPAKVVLLLRDEGNGIKVVDYVANTEALVLLVETDADYHMHAHKVLGMSKPNSEQEFMEQVHDMLVGYPHGLDAKKVNQALEIK